MSASRTREQGSKFRIAQVIGLVYHYLLLNFSYYWQTNDSRIVLETSSLWLIFIEGCCNPYVFKLNHRQKEEEIYTWPSTNANTLHHLGKIRKGERRGVGEHI